MRSILILGLFVILIGQINCQPEKGKTLKVMTFNIRYGTAKDSLNSWPYRRSILIDCLKKNTPDILGTQEALDFQIDFIREAFPAWKVFGVGRYYQVQVPDRPQESGNGESCNILYDSTKFKLIRQGTYWHSDTPDVPGSITWGNSLARITTWGILQEKNSGKNFVVMNTHFHSGEPYVTNTTNLIIKKWQEIAPDMPAILLGDFNLEPGSATHQRFCEKRSGSDQPPSYFIDCWQALAKPETGAATSHGFDGSTTRSRIDWILVTPEFNIRNITIIHDNLDGRYPSDHYPVMAELQ